MNDMEFLTWLSAMTVVSAIVVAIPLIVVLTTVAAVYWSGRYGGTGSSADHAA